MNIFSVKSIGLYSLVISGAIGFFHFVTSYGEANLKAPISVSGKYLVAAKNLPTCLEGKTLVLNLQQSGIYLNANLIKIDGLERVDILELGNRSELITTKDIRPTFSGQLQNRQFKLSGLLPISICPQSSSLVISGSLVAAPASKIEKSNPSNIGINQHPQQQLEGQLRIALSNRPTPPVEFIGMPISRIRATQSH
jgi:hypothetical protein